MKTFKPTPTEIRRLRKRLGLTTTEFAAKIGASTSTVEKWEGGRTIPLRAFQDRLLQLANPGKTSETPSAERLEELAFMKLSLPSLWRSWDSPEDAIYDDL
ncbi:MAG: helix-turn-helix domain-containing protein [bacterium]